MSSKIDVKPSPSVTIWVQPLRRKKAIHPKTYDSLPLNLQTKNPVSKGFSCNGKKYCKQMTSCAEAKFHLTQCKHKKLDRDEDSIPCEALCK